MEGSSFYASSRLSLRIRLFSSFVCPFSLIKVLPRGVLMGKGGLGRIGGRNGREEVGEGGERTQDKNVMSGL